MLATGNSSNEMYIHSLCNQQGLNLLDTFISMKVPVIVGVDWRLGTVSKRTGQYSNLDGGITDHWVVIVGRYIDPKDGPYYTYFEVAQQLRIDGVSTEYNRFFITDEGYLLGDNKTVGETSKDSRRPLVTQIRLLTPKKCPCSREIYNSDSPPLDVYSEFNHITNPMGNLIDTKRTIIK